MFQYVMFSPHTPTHATKEKVHPKRSDFSLLIVPNQEPGMNFVTHVLNSVVSMGLIPFLAFSRI